MRPFSKNSGYFYIGKTVRYIVTSQSICAGKYWNTYTLKSTHLYTYTHKLTHLPPGQIAAFPQTIFSYAFSWMKRFVLRLIFHGVFLRVQLTINQHYFRRQTIIWTNADPVHWHIYAALGGDELTGLRFCYIQLTPQIAKFMEPTWGPPGFCRPQMGPMLAPRTLLSGTLMPQLHLPYCGLLFLTNVYKCNVNVLQNIHEPFSYRIHKISIIMNKDDCKLPSSY